MTQCEKILLYMETFGSITPMDALEHFGVMRLAARIGDLRAQGVPIRSETVTRRNRFGEPVTFSQYSIVKE